MNNFQKLKKDYIEYFNNMETFKREFNKYLQKSLDIDQINQIDKLIERRIRTYRPTGTDSELLRLNRLSIYAGRVNSFCLDTLNPKLQTYLKEEDIDELYNHITFPFERYTPKDSIFRYNIPLVREFDDNTPNTYIQVMYEPKYQQDLYNHFRKFKESTGFTVKDHTKKQCELLEDYTRKSKLKDYLNFEYTTDKRDGCVFEVYRYTKEQMKEFRQAKK